ncbi:MAG: hypothetical protein E6I44_03150 [Chloroflexi bacterium]|nr:MAG: hypothetical protein E6I44_03150 [Chloroflexota bacterium]
MSKRGYPASEMGPQLLAHVEQELLEDLHSYGMTTDTLVFDWSNPCEEGHVTRYLDGQLEDMSGVSVVDLSGRVQARGWIDFVHGAAEAPLFVFWLYLDVRHGDGWRRAKDDPGLPAHVWTRLPDRSKQLCATSDRYDARWSKDPLVTAWREAHRLVE